MKWIIILLTLPLIAATPIYVDYPDKNSIYQEFRNVFDNLQDQMFTQVFVSTPAYTDLKDGAMVIYVSTPNTPQTDVHLILRSGTTLYVSPSWTVIKGR